MSKFQNMKMFLHAWLGRRHAIPTYNDDIYISASGQQRYRSEVSVPQIPFTGVADTDLNAKAAKTMAADDLCKKLVRYGLMNPEELRTLQLISRSQRLDFDHSKVPLPPVAPSRERTPQNRFRPTERSFTDRPQGWERDSSADRRILPSDRLRADGDGKTDRRKRFRDSDEDQEENFTNVEQAGNVKSVSRPSSVEPPQLPPYVFVCPEIPTDKTGDIHFDYAGLKRATGFSESEISKKVVRDLSSIEERRIIPCDGPVASEADRILRQTYDKIISMGGGVFVKSNDGSLVRMTAGVDPNAAEESQRPISTEPNYQRYHFKKRMIERSTNEEIGSTGDPSTAGIKNFVSPENLNADPVFDDGASSSSSGVKERSGADRDSAGGEPPGSMTHIKEEPES